MNRSLRFLVAIGALAVAVLISAALPCNAGSVKAGLRYWYPMWDRDQRYGFEDDPETDWGMVGPALDIELADQWSLTGAFMFGQFDCEYEGGAKDTMDRYDFLMDINFRPFSEHVSPFMQSLKFVVSGQYIHWTETWETSAGETDYEYKKGIVGPGLGIAAAKSHGRFFWSLFGGYAYLFPVEDADDDTDYVHMVHGNAGVGYAVTPNLVLDLCYRVEWLDYSYKEFEIGGLKSADSANDVFHGPHLTVSYYIQ